MSLKKCSSCGNDIATSAKVCPSCGAKNDKPFYKKWWFWILVVLILAAAGKSATGSNSNISGTRTNENSTTETTVAAQEAKTEETTVSEAENENLIDGKYELVNGELNTIDENMLHYVTGSLKNTTNKKYSYAQITFILYDADGAQIGTALDNVNDWEAGGVWKFKAMFMDDNVASFKLSEVTAF